MAKTVDAYRAYTPAELKSKADIPDAADIEIGVRTILCSNIKMSDVKSVLGETSDDLSVLCTSSNVNKWSAYSPYTRDVSGTPNIYGNGATLRHNKPTSNYSLGSFAGYNHGANVPSITSTKHDDDLYMSSGGSDTFSCSVTIGELDFI